MSLADLQIHRAPLFASLPPEAFNTLTSMLQEASYPAGTILCAEGEHGDRFYIVLAGRIEIIKALGTSNERLLDIRGAGDFIGEMSLLSNDGLRSASLRARTRVRVLELHRTDFETLLRTYPSIAYTMLRVLSTRLRASNDAALRELHEKNERLAQAYADLRAAQAQIVEHETLMRELRVAREIQESMLPSELPQFTGFDIGARSMPARMVGGDFFDIVPIDSTHIGIAVGDVSGKGIPAALFMALASSLLRAEVTRGVAPEEALRTLNRHLMSRNTSGMFVTLLYGVINRQTGAFSYVRAGHELPLCWDVEGTPVDVSLNHGMPLGLLPDPVLDVQTILLPPGGTLLLYTDGAIEAMNPAGAMFGYDQLHAIAYRHNGTAQALCDNLMWSILEHHGSAAQTDDVTLVAVRLV